MALNTPNYGYPTVNFSTAFSSTPSGDGPRSQRPRFAYSGPSMYPRPRSSASKPNPDIDFTESIADNFGSQMSSSENDYVCNDNRPYNDSCDSYSSQKSNYYNSSYPQKLPSYYNSSYDESLSSEKSNYFSCNESLHASNNQSSLDRKSEITDNYSMMVNTSQSFYGNNNDKFFSTYLENYKEKCQSYNEGGTNSNYQMDYSTKDCEYFTGNYQNKSSGNFKGNFQPNYGNGNFKGNFQAKYNTRNFQSNSASGNFKGTVRKFKAKQKKKSFDQKFLKGKPGMEQKSALRCDLCNLNFTSMIPMEMHMQGKNHIKKMKSQLALQAIVGTATRNEVNIGNSFKCELCNLTLNSSLQLQMHLDGNKHKNKLQQEEKKKASGTEQESNKDEFEAVNGKGMIRPLPSDFEEMQPAKLSKFSCDLCNVIVNSSMQLQQHLDSKRHKAKLEGKPFKVFKKKNKKNAANMQSTDEDKGIDQNEGEQKQEQAPGQEQVTEKEKAPEEEVSEQEQQQAQEQKEQQERRKSQTVLGIKTLHSTFIQGETLN